MTTVEVIYAIAALASGIAAVAAWIAKIRWSQEYAEAKEAQIDMLKAHIESLEKLSPMKIQEYFESVTSQLEGFIDRLKDQLDEAQTKGDELQQLISSLELEGEARKAELGKAIEEKAAIEHEAAHLENQLKIAESTPPMQIRVPSISTGTYEELVQSSSGLQEAMGGPPSIFYPSSSAIASLDAGYRAGLLAEQQRRASFVWPKKDDEDQDQEDVDTEAEDVDE